MNTTERMNWTFIKIDLLKLLTSGILNVIVVLQVVQDLNTTKGSVTLGIS